KIIKLLFPFKYPINCDTLNFGGIMTNIWIWSLHAFASCISTFFLSQSSLIICPILFLYFPYIICLLYFGAKTRFYLLLICVCVILLLLFFVLSSIYFMILCLGNYLFFSLYTSYLYF